MSYLEASVSESAQSKDIWNDYFSCLFTLSCFSTCSKLHLMAGHWEKFPSCLLLYCIFLQLNPSSTVKEIVYKSPAEEWHPREGNGENIKGLKKSTFQSVLNRPLLDDGGVDSSTDTLVPESDVEERRKLYSSALRQEQHLQRGCSCSCPTEA